MVMLSHFPGLKLMNELLKVLQSKTEIGRRELEKNMIVYFILAKH